MSKNNRGIKRFARYIHRTFKNKLCALALIILGVLTTNIEGEGTVLLFLSMIALPLFFSDENWIY